MSLPGLATLDSELRRDAGGALAARRFSNLGKEENHREADHPVQPNNNDVTVSRLRDLANGQVNPYAFGDKNTPPQQTPANGISQTVGQLGDLASIAQITGQPGPYAFGNKDPQTQLELDDVRKRHIRSFINLKAGEKRDVIDDEVKYQQAHKEQLDDEPEEEEKSKKHWFLPSEMFAAGAALVATAMPHWHRHRFKALWRLLKGKDVEVTVVKEEKVKTKTEGKPTDEEIKAREEAAAKEEALKREREEAAAREEAVRKENAATKVEKEGQELSQAQKAEREAADLAKTGRAGQEAVSTERGVVSAGRAEGAAASLRTAVEVSEETKVIRTLSTVTRTSRKGGLAGLFASLIVLPATAAVAYAKTMPENTSTIDQITGGLKAGVNTFSFLNKDWMTAFGKGDVVDGLDKFFGVSDAVRLFNLAENDPEQFKKELREMADGASKFADWAQKNPEKFNKMLEDPEKYMQDPQFAKDIGTAVHEGLDGNKDTAQTKGLDALERAQKISAGGGGRYKTMDTEDAPPAPSLSTDPREHLVSRAQPDKPKPTEGG